MTIIFFHRNDSHPVIIFLQIRTIEKIPQASCLSYNSVPCLYVLSVAKVLSFFVFRLVVIFTNKTIDSRFHGNDKHPVIIFLQSRTIEKIPQASCLSYNSVRVYPCYQWLKFFLCVIGG